MNQTTASFPLISLPRFVQRKSRKPVRFALFCITLSLSLGWGMRPNIAHAESPATAPVSLKNTLSQIETAANNRSLKAVMQFYGSNFSHSDGLTRQQLEEALAQLWKRYSKLTYRTELKSWQPVANGILAETVTYIKGTQTVDGKVFNLESTMRSQQRFEGQKIVRQEVLAERNRLTSGTKPPTLEVNLPEQVNTGQPFNFDAVVKEAVGEDILLGAALEEPVKAGSYLTTAPVNLEVLSAGGLFKVGQAASTPDNRWLSAIVVRESGMTMVTQRLRIVNPNQ